MSSNNKQTDLLKVEPATIAQVRRSFYRPHKRVPYTGELVNHATGEVTKPPSLTKQSFKDECDINNIIKQYKVTGMITHMSANASRGVYADLPDESDFQTAIAVVAEANSAFNTLPSKIRDRFGNDPAKFLAFCQDPANAKEMQDLGLAKAPAAQDPPKPPAPDAPPPASTE